MIRIQQYRYLFLLNFPKKFSTFNKSVVMIRDFNRTSMHLKVVIVINSLQSLQHFETHACCVLQQKYLFNHVDIFASIKGTQA